MRIDEIPLNMGSPGTRHTLQVLRFGTPGRGPKAMIQAALHADEVPAMLVASALREQLATLDAQGAVLGEVILVPFANPIGLDQHVLGQQHGRFDLRSGVNFNRNLPDLSAAAVAAVQGRLGVDAAANVTLARAALRDAAAGLRATHLVEHLKHTLLALAIDADIVLDLHCDHEAAMHLYGLTPQADSCVELGALLGAQAILLATESGDQPFDEACSRPWLALQLAYPEHPIPLACFSTTVELRGQADTSHRLASGDATAIVEFLRRRGMVAGMGDALLPLPAALCEPTPLAASEPVTAQHAGVVVFHAAAGARVAAGAHIADIVCPQSGRVHPLHCESSGVLYARIATRWALPGTRVAKVAGTALARTGKLLGA